MKFEEYNPNSKHCDCIIRTFMKLLGKSYIKVKEELNEVAHSLGYDSYGETEVFEKYFEKNGYSKIDAEDILVKDLSFDNPSFDEIFSTTGSISFTDFNNNNSSAYN